MPNLSTDADLQAVADSDSVLVPIRIDVDVDGFKIKDTFTWNLHGKL